MPREIQEIGLQVLPNGRLNIPPGHIKEVNKSDFVVWSLLPNSRLTKFEIITKSGADIFVSPPHQNGSEWTAEIKQDATDEAQYSYAIKYWKEGVTQPVTLDPIIAIKPSDKDSIGLAMFLPIIGVIVVGAIRFRGISSFLRRRNTRTKLNRR